MTELLRKLQSGSKISREGDDIMSKKLIAFYSRNGENYFGGAMKEVEVGNTKIAAQILQQMTNADLFEIEQLNPYSSHYKECVAQAVADSKSNARPELAHDIDIEEYETIYLGYPNYCGTMPMAVWTFLEAHDFKGKTIKPFCTNEGSGMGKSEADLAHLCPTAQIEKGLSIKGSEAADSSTIFTSWIS